MRWLLVAVCALALAVLVGCGSQDEVIGRGPASLVFTGDGDDDTYIKVSWQGDYGQWLSRDFTVYSEGRVELRLEDRLTYYISLDPPRSPASAEASAAAPGTGKAQNEVIVVGGERDR